MVRRRALGKVRPLLRMADHTRAFDSFTAVLGGPTGICVGTPLAASAATSAGVPAIPTGAMLSTLASTATPAMVEEDSGCGAPILARAGSRGKWEPSPLAPLLNGHCRGLGEGWGRLHWQRVTSFPLSQRLQVATGRGG